MVTFCFAIVSLLFDLHPAWWVWVGLVMYDLTTAERRRNP